MLTPINQDFKRRSFLQYLRGEKTCKRGRRQWTVEPLEERAMFVVGANASVAPLPLDQYTGVVHLAGDAANFPTAARCSGTLLDSGRHILTAAHCVAQNETQQINIFNTQPGPLSGTFNLIFQGQATAPIPFGASAAQVETALENLNNITNVRVSSSNSLRYNVTFLGEWALTNVQQMIIVPNINNGIATVSTTSNGFQTTPNLRFDLPSGSFVYNVQPGDVNFHQSFRNILSDEDGDQAGYDIAVITLPAIAPAGAERFELYTNRDEVGKEVTFVGYGRTGQGSTGEDLGPPDTAGVRRAGINTFDNISAVTGYLQADFDDGTAANNAMGDLGEGNLETSIARGDSGGAGLVNNQVAGIHGSVTGVGFGRFGTVLHLTRVSDFVQHRDPLFDVNDIMEKPDDIVLDMSLQDAGNDGQADTIDVRLVGPGKNTVEISINGSVVWSDLKTRVLSLTIRGSDDRDTVRFFDDLSVPVTVYGYKGDDSLYGGNGNEILYGGAGHDVINGGGGHDEVYGEADGDTLYGGSGNDLIVGGAGIDTLYGGLGNDRMIGGFKLESLSDSNIDVSFDMLYGNEGNDTIFGDDGSFVPLIVRENAGGNDVIRGGIGNDVIIAGFGHDNIQGQGDNDTIFGGSGNDIIVGGYQLDGTQSFADGGDTIDAGDGSDYVYGDNFNPALAPTFSALGGSDVIRGGNGNDIIYGQTGHDELRGEDGLDMLNGGIGNDSIYGGNDKDLMYGEAGTDLMFGNEGPDELFGGDQNDILVGGTGGDRLFGESGNDTINGEADFDLAVGGFGVDRITGGDGNDILIGGNLSIADNSADEIDGDAGDDQIFGDSSDSIETNSPVGGDDTLRGGLGMDRIYGMVGNDFIGGGDDNDIIDAGPGNDIANGDAGNDNLRGGLGNDVLAGSGGTDILQGDAGDDWLIGGFYANTGIAMPDASTDHLSGGTGNDRLFGDSWSLEAPLEEGIIGGNDNLNGDSGDDFLAGQVGDDTLTGGAGNDELVGGAGNDSLVGQLGSDNLQGGDGNDLLRGNEDDDQLQGGTGNDILLGGTGTDSMQGGGGRDILIGGLEGDRMNGDGDDDLLIGGITSFDANDLALRALSAEWSSIRSYSDRISNLRGVPNPQFANRLNGNNFLNLGVTVQHDGGADIITGGTEKDWFFASQVAPPTVDVVADLENGEVIN